MFLKFSGSISAIRPGPPTMIWDFPQFRQNSVKSSAKFKYRFLQHVSKNNMLAQMRAKKNTRVRKIRRNVAELYCNYTTLKRQNANVEFGDVQKRVNLVDDDCEKCCNISISNLNYFEVFRIFSIFLLNTKIGFDTAQNGPSKDWVTTTPDLHPPSNHPLF